MRVRSRRRRRRRRIKEQEEEEDKRSRERRRRIKEQAEEEEEDKGAGGETHRLNNTGMGVQGFQEYLEKRCPGAAVPVDLLKLARTPGRQPPHPHHPHHPGPMPPPPPARILIDADSGLQRLYGGYQTDWVCGGEWNAMLGYLAALSQACLYQGGLELVVCVQRDPLGKERGPVVGRAGRRGQRTDSPAHRLTMSAGRLPASPRMVPAPGLPQPLCPLAVRSECINSCSLSSH
ncbi:unnamed protein product [Coregonus sp. 'balchen']|nr:unnamed protein product [Coregonus sp. 'balchen']